jgi:hypothetical protein
MTPKDHSYYLINYHAVLTDGVGVETIPGSMVVKANPSEGITDKMIRQAKDYAHHLFNFRMFNIRIVIETVHKVPGPQLINYAIDLTQKSKK